RRGRAVGGNVATAQREILLLLLRRSPANLTPSRLEAAARSAWSSRFGPNIDGSDYLWSGTEGSGFVLQAHGNAFSVFGASKGVRELDPPHRIDESESSIWSNYSHDVSVSVAHCYDTDPQRLCAYVANLVAELVDQDTLGLLHLGSRQ